MKEVGNKIKINNYNIYKYIHHIQPKICLDYVTF